MVIVPPILLSIRAEADALAPNRSHASDGTVGDAAHAARESDHNPDADGVVHAIDLTHDPAGGFDSYWHGERLRVRCQEGVETRVKYVVSFDTSTGRDRIASPIDGWIWRAKTTSDHGNHLHVSVLYTDEVENSTEPMLTDPPTNEREDEDVVVFWKSETSATVWAVDGLGKRRMKSMDDVAAVDYLGLSKKPMEIRTVPQSWLDRIPTVASQGFVKTFVRNLLGG